MFKLAARAFNDARLLSPLMLHLSHLIAATPLLRHASISIFHIATPLQPCTAPKPPSLDPAPQLTQQKLLVWSVSSHPPTTHGMGLLISWHFSTIREIFVLTLLPVLQSGHPGPGDGNASGMDDVTNSASKAAQRNPLLAQQDV